MNHQDERLQAEALDHYISARQSGHGSGSPTGIPVAENELLEELLHMAESAQPSTDFVTQVAENLRATSQLRARAGGTQLRRSGTRWMGFPITIERILTMNKPIRFTLVGTAALVIFLSVVALPFVIQQIWPVKPPEIALVPPAAAETSVPALLFPGETPIDTAVDAPIEIPAEASPALVTEPPDLPPLEAWITGGYGGGGGLPPTVLEFILNAALPKSPAQIKAWRQQIPEPLTAASMQDTATQLGMANASFYQGGAVEWPREIAFGLDAFHYTDRSILPSNGTWIYPPHEFPPADQAAAVAQAFLEEHNLLGFAYRHEVRNDSVRFFHLLEGQWALNSPFAEVSVRADGQIGRVSYHDYTFDNFGTYPVIPVQDAWQMLVAGEPKARLWYNFYPATSLNPKVWIKSYTTGQRADVFAPLQVRPPLDPAQAPIITVGSLVLTGGPSDLGSLAQSYEALVQQTLGVEAPMHVWGTVKDEGGYLTLQLEGWESVFSLDPMAGLLDTSGAPYQWAGVIQRHGDQGILLTDEFQPVLNGQTFQIFNLPVDLPAGAAVYVQGGLVGERIEWSLIQERPDDESIQSPRSATALATVEQVEMIYLAPQTTLMAETTAAPEELRVLMPVWRFSGHLDNGDGFQIWVQAVAAEYLR